MENRGLLFIPDISGFSRFVNAVEIEHSRFINGPDKNQAAIAPYVLSSS